MLTDTKLRSLKPQDKLYKVSDRDGLYVAVTKSGVISFRYDYRFNGRRETVTFGRYSADGITLAEARAELIEAKRLLNVGISPASKKRDGIESKKIGTVFKDYTVNFLRDAQYADSTRAMKEAIIEKEIYPVFGKLQLEEITTPRLRALCEKIKDRGAKATALQVREIVGSVFTYAIDRGYEISNPADAIKASSIGTFQARERAMSPKEIGILFRELENYSCYPTLKLAVKFVLLTLVRKSEFIHATWDEIDFKNRQWVIPKGRMKGRKEHVIYLSDQAMDILTGMKVCAMGSDYLMPGRYDIKKPLSNAALNNVIDGTVKRINEKGIEFEPVTVHDLRRTASTLLHEAGYNSDWIEKCLAHVQNGVRAVYNKAEYAEQRRKMLQEWADMVDEWIKEKD
ncbi:MULTISPECIES: tyrosine-type recombinase/integrase [Enterobacterales]|uniref:tyrosine-type recombinase/integrase n=1 Tax=Enterobacterales TaxID=91347 RepID=UPI0008482B8A|nr:MULTISPECIES: site-specific integrase [Enterobacterales]MCE5371403.1 tyrosine-type recombinase/integrase [Proteus mirabilis]MCX2589376.1 tyrosine-type recombinase/integrase [Proteus penneri]MDM3673812.1 tyrosine-type recombinase/integrase [Proteus mirabilis]MDM3797892.1 tyrosine-type recombinase/integrase [Proteus mirabilis]NBL90344.1 tyrosine-type recombinase/integrase [Proteus sp. G2673]